MKNSLQNMKQFASTSKYGEFHAIPQMAEGKRTTGAGTTLVISVTPDAQISGGGTCLIIIKKVPIFCVLLVFVCPSSWPVCDGLIKMVMSDLFEA